jgi:hypothetical protein
MAQKNESLFSRLTKLFRSGPVIKSKVKGYSPSTASSSYEMFRRNVSDVYSSTVSAYGAFDRMSRYSDFSEMEATPEISSALDIYSEESSSQDEAGKVLHVYSENRVIRELLEELFYDILNVDFNLPMWTRNLCKYGDFFAFLDVDPKYGVVNLLPIPIAEIEREEGYDPQDPMAVRFRWITKGNKTLENWQVVHFRLLGNDAFLPYGASVLESARRVWRQLILSEDAMLLYRVVRAPERRIFYIDVGNVPPEEVQNYMEQAQSTLKRNMVIDKATGRVDLRFNPLSGLDDYFIPVRGGESGTKIDTLAGGQNTAAVEDVQYIQKKLFAALKIPKAYLGYDEEIGSKATLAQEDIRFSRTISRIQKVIISELNKIAMIHLYSHGFTDESILNFKLMLNNPSSVAQMQKLELIKTKFEIAGAAPEGAVDRGWLRRNVLGLTEEEIAKVKEGRKEDKKEDADIESGGESGDTGVADTGGGDAGGTPDTDEEAGGGEENLFAGYEPLGRSTSGFPVNPSNEVKNAWGNEINKKEVTRSKKRGERVLPDFKSMTSVGSSTRTQDTSNRPFGNVMDGEELFEEDLPISLAEAMLDEKVNTFTPRVTQEMEGIFKKLSGKIGSKLSSKLLSEDIEDTDIDLESE